MVPAPLLILGAWAALLAVVMGVGFAAVRLCPGPPEVVEGQLAFWVGLAVICPVLAGYHLLLPVDGRVWLLLAPAGLAGLVLELRDRRFRPTTWVRTNAAAACCFVVLAFWLATRAALPGFSVDDGLYYTQIVRWYSAYPAVPGLGNLHPYLALNNAYHLFVAAAGAGPFHLRGHHLVNGLLLLVTLAACGRSFLRMLDVRRALHPDDWIAALLFGVAIEFAVSPNLSIGLADFAVQMCGTGLLLAATQPVLRRESVGEKRMTALVAACSGAMILKQSLLCIALPVATFAAVHWVMGAPRNRRLGGVLSALAIASAILLPWIAHGVVLSGLPFYPSDALAAGVDWRMNPDVVRVVFRWVYAFARWPGHSWAEVTGSRHWIAIWFGKAWLENRAFLLPVALAVVGVIHIAAARIAGRRPPAFSVAALIPACAGIGLWWMLAPDTRFAGPLLWCAGALAILAGALAYPGGLQGPGRLALTGTALGIAAGAFVGWRASFPLTRELPPLRHSTRVGTAHLLTGETISVDAGDGCWDPPCGSPPIDPRLRLRRPGDWASGFTLAPLAPQGAAAIRQSAR